MDWYSFLVIHDRVIAVVEKICLEDKAEERRQQGRKWMKNEEAEIEKRRRKWKSKLNRISKIPTDYWAELIAVEAQAWEKFISYQVGPFL